MWRRGPEPLAPTVSSVPSKHDELLRRTWVWVRPGLAAARTVLALLNNPGQWRQLRDDPGLVRLAVEEGLRYDGTAQLLQRIARADLVLRGRTIRRGDLLYL